MQYIMVSKQFHVILINESRWVATWMLGADCSVIKNSEGCTITNGCQIVVLNVATDVEKIQIEDVEISEEYGVKRRSIAIRIYGNQPVLSVDFKIVLN